MPWKRVPPQAVPVVAFGNSRDLIPRVVVFSVDGVGFGHAWTPALPNPSWQLYPRYRHLPRLH